MQISISSAQDTYVTVHTFREYWRKLLIHWDWLDFPFITSTYGIHIEKEFVTSEWYLLPISGQFTGTESSQSLLSTQSGKTIVMSGGTFPKNISGTGWIALEAKPGEGSSPLLFLCPHPL